MSTRANWHVDLVSPSTADPFSEQETLDVEVHGRVIELDDEAKLNERVIALVNKEGRLYARGIRCAIRDENDSCCSACGVRCTDSQDPLKSLCDLGAEQERVLTQLAVQRHVQAPGPESPRT